MIRDKKVGMIIPAAGRGSRMGEDKQFLHLAGTPIVLHTLLAFQNSDEVDFIVVAARPEHFDRFRELKEANRLSKLAALVPGGPTRQASVWNALQAVPENPGLVAVHDAVRPLVDRAETH